MFPSTSNQQITRIHAYALLTQGNVDTESVHDIAVDTMALMLPLESLPAAALDYLDIAPSPEGQIEPIEVTLTLGVAHWLGADHKHHQIGETHKPLNFNVVHRLQSETGLLTAFVETHSGRPRYWAILKKHNAV